MSKLQRNLRKSCRKLSNIFLFSQIRRRKRRKIRVVKRRPAGENSSDSDGKAVPNVSGSDDDDGESDVDNRVAGIRAKRSLLTSKKGEVATDSPPPPPLPLQLQSNGANPMDGGPMSDDIPLPPV